MTVLNEKNVPYDIEYIELNNKPDWFLEISPTGKVPVVQTEDGHALFESAVINEFLDESHEPRLLPETPLARAYDRMWRDYIAGLYGDAFRLYRAESEEAARELVAGMQPKLAKVEEEVQAPYFCGERFSLVDVTAGPFFRRVSFVTQVDPTLDPFGNFPKTAVWGRAVLARPSVQDSVLPNLFDIFKEGLQKNNLWLASRIKS